MAPRNTKPIIFLLPKNSTVPFFPGRFILAISKLSNSIVFAVKTHQPLTLLAVKILLSHHKNRANSKHSQDQ